jgi:GAG-pre-integrase domain
MEMLPVKYHGLPFHEYIQQNTPVASIKAATERLLWHQRLGHPSDYYLFNAHKHVDGVPQFKHMDPVLETCPTCINAKQKKEPAGPNPTRTATVPYQGLSIDFSFSGTKSKNPGRAKDYVGLNGETSWILITDHATRMKHGDTRLSKAPPLQHWLRHFLQQHKPACPGKYVCLDQGGELYNNPAMVKMIREEGYEIRPTGADASNQNGPVERGHLTVANAIRAQLLGANLPVKFWPYAFHHWLRIDNSIPSKDQPSSPLFLATGLVSMVETS